MIPINGKLMSGDREIASIRDNEIVDCVEALLPLYLKRTRNLEGWLASRAIDAHRTNSRLLKKVLRLKTSDDAETALAVNAATITDQYWIKPDDSELCWEDVRFKENFFDALALRGDPDSFSRKPTSVGLNRTVTFPHRSYSLIPVSKLIDFMSVSIL